MSSDSMDFSWAISPSQSDPSEKEVTKDEQDRKENTPDKNDPNLLGLPVEVRRQILCHLLSTKETRVVERRWNDMEPSMYADVTWNMDAEDLSPYDLHPAYTETTTYNIQTAIARVNKQLYRESAQILYRDNKWVSIQGWTSWHSGALEELGLQTRIFNVDGVVFQNGETLNPAFVIELDDLFKNDDEEVLVALEDLPAVAYVVWHVASHWSICDEYNLWFPKDMGPRSWGFSNLTNFLRFFDAAICDFLRRGTKQVGFGDQTVDEIKAQRPLTSLERWINGGLSGPYLGTQAECDNHTRILDGLISESVAALQADDGVTAIEKFQRIKRKHEVLEKFPIDRTDAHDKLLTTALQESNLRLALACFHWTMMPIGREISWRSDNTLASFREPRTKEGVLWALFNNKRAVNLAEHIPNVRLRSHWQARIRFRQAELEMLLRASELDVLFVLQSTAHMALKDSKQHPDLSEVEQIEWARRLLHGDQMEAFYSERPISLNRSTGDLPPGAWQDKFDRVEAFLDSTYGSNKTFTIERLDPPSDL